MQHRSKCRSLFEEAFDTGFINDAKKKADDEFSAINIEIRELELTNELLINNSISTGEHIKQRKEFLMQFETNRNEKLSIHKKRIKQDKILMSAYTNNQEPSVKERDDLIKSIKPMKKALKIKQVKQPNLL